MQSTMPAKQLTALSLRLALRRKLRVTLSTYEVNLVILCRNLDSSAAIKAKINNVGLLSLGYTQTLRPGVKATLGLALDTQKLSGASSTSAHKVITFYNESGDVSLSLVLGWCIIRL